MFLQRAILLSELHYCSVCSCTFIFALYFVLLFPVVPTLQLGQLREDLIETKQEKRRLATELKSEVEAKQRALEKASALEKSIDEIKRNEIKLQDALILMRSQPVFTTHALQEVIQKLVRAKLPLNTHVHISKFRKAAVPEVKMPEVDT